MSASAYPVYDKGPFFTFGMVCCLEAGVVSSRQTWTSDAEARVYSLHNMTGVDKAHMHGYFGKGAVVAVVDTGVDWSHPAVGDCKARDTWGLVIALTFA